MLQYQGSCYSDLETAYKAVCDNMSLVQQHVIYSCNATSTAINLTATDVTTNQTNSFTLQPVFNDCNPDFSALTEMSAELYILPVLALVFMQMRRMIK